MPPSRSAELDLAGKTALVTGAARGIGRAVADRLAAFGADTLLVDLDETPLEATAAELMGEHDVRVRWLAVDVASDDGLAAITTAAGSGLDVLVNNAGIVRTEPLADQPRADWERVRAVNLEAPLELSRNLIGPLRTRRGNVVNIASVAALHALAGSGAYGPTKAALVSLTRQLAVEWGRYGIRVNAVAPGLTRTGLTKGTQGDSDVSRARVATVPLGRIGEPEDVARAVHFLASDMAEYVSGETLVVDGAWRHALLPEAMAVGRR